MKIPLLKECKNILRDGFVLKNLIGNTEKEPFLK